jgi:alpha-1,3-glucan synthase
VVCLTRCVASAFFYRFIFTDDAKIRVFSCLAIRILGIDAIHINKVPQIMVDALVDWVSFAARLSVRTAFSSLARLLVLSTCKLNSYFASVLLIACLTGRVRSPMQRPVDFAHDANVASDIKQRFLRSQPRISLDAVSSHYSVHRTLSRVLGMDTNLQTACDIQTKFNTMANSDIWIYQRKHHLVVQLPLLERALCFRFLLWRHDDS